MARMTRLEMLERPIAALSTEAYARIRESYEVCDAAEWDRQLGADVVSGKLDRLAEEAVADHQAGRSRAL